MLSKTRSSRSHSTWPAHARNAVTVLVSAVLLAGCGDSPEAMLESAKGYIAKDDLNAAVIQLKNALQEDGSLAEGRYLLGKINLEQGDMLGAVKEFERALQYGYANEKVTPLLARALLGSAEVDRVLKEFGATTLNDNKAQAELLGVLGDAHLAKADVQKARKAFESALELNPEDDLARVGLGRAKLFSGDAGGALAEAESVIARRADLAEAQVLLADVMMVQGNQEAAVAALKAAVKAKPDSVSHNFALVSLMLRQNDFEGAAIQLEAMKKIAPKHPSTRYVQAFLDFRNGRLPEARDEILEVVKNAPEFLPARLLAGSVLVRMNEHTQARPHLSMVVAGAPRQTLARRLLAASHLATGEASRALEIIQPLLASPGQDAALAGLVGQIYLAMGDYDRAEVFLARSAQGAPDDARARTRLGVARLAGGDVARAYADLEAASALDESSGQADLALILAHMRRGEFDRALDAQKVLEQKQPNSAQTYNLKGGILLAKRDVAGARLAFDKALELQPGFLAAAINLGRLDLAEKKPEVAKARFERIIKATPENVEAWLAYADLQSATGSDPKEVLTSLERAAAAGPGLLPPQLALIQHFLRVREPAKAMTIALQASTAHASDPRAIEALARVQMAAGETQQAIASLNKLSSFAPRSPGPLVLLSDAQRQGKDDSAAEQSLLKALALKPDLLEAQQRLFAIQASRGDRDAALQTAKTVQKQQPTVAAGYVLEGDVLVSSGRWAEAAAAYRKAMDRGTSGELVNKLHSALMRSSRKAEADKVMSDWLSSEPNDLVARGYMAERALGEKRYGDALQLFRAMNELSPGNALILNNLAWTAAAAKDGQALTYAEQALSAAPDNPVVLDTIGMIQVDAGQIEKGVANLERAVSLAPDIATLRLNLAKTYARLDRKADAKKMLQALLPKLEAGSPIQAEAAELLKAL
ncbi:MAG: PEP-CTERM system TPR-repeat protein PrsT [Azoarcus sp. PHD]|nr:MAG: PEP-CTERM system TPR-repeat protein PrsT [Azoarcus sp. PHD]